MPELGEIISVPALTKNFANKCPFKQPTDPKIIDLQENDGTILGLNLEGKKPGEGDDGPFPPGSYLFKQIANDSNNGEKSLITLKKYKEAEAGDFPFLVAAHHLIPGNASLYKEDVKLVNYMKDGGKIKSIKGKEYTIKGNIGYDVNGSHNGVWLPGNYAVKRSKPKRIMKNGTVIAARQGTTPVKGMSWLVLGESGYEKWQLLYVAGACKAAKAQFHDTHESPYSSSVRKNLLKIVTALSSHLDSQCPDCKNMKKVLPPPYRIKSRLYALSNTLREHVSGSPNKWKAPWFTSERWSSEFCVDGKITKDFLRAYSDADVVKE